MTGRDSVRRSVEVEYWVIDEAGRLTKPGDLVDASPGAEREFVEPLIEIKTTPCETTAELRAELFRRVGSVLDRADELDKGLAPLATTVDERDVAERPNVGTDIQNRVVGENFEYVRHCAGTHVHVEQRPEDVIDEVNACIALDPALALVNSSPFFRGRRLAAGARSKLYRWMAYEDVPHQGRLWPYASDVEEWTERLNRRYDEFVTAATDAGVDRHVVEAHFDPEKSVWTPVQLRERFGTVVWRSPDATLPSQVVRLADDLVGVVGHLRDREVRIRGTSGRVTDDAVVLPEFDAVTGYVDAAIRRGLDSTAVRDYLERMRFDVASYDPVTHGMADRDEVTGEEARDLRLDHARRLERDVERGRPSG